MSALLVAFSCPLTMQHKPLFGIHIVGEDPLVLHETCKHQPRRNSPTTQDVDQQWDLRILLVESFSYYCGGSLGPGRVDLFVHKDSKKPEDITQEECDKFAKVWREACPHFVGDITLEDINI